MTIIVSFFFQGCIWNQLHTNLKENGWCPVPCNIPWLCTVHHRTTADSQLHYDWYRRIQVPAVCRRVHVTVLQTLCLQSDFYPQCVPDWLDSHTEQPQEFLVYTFRWVSSMICIQSDFYPQCVPVWLDSHTEQPQEFIVYIFRWVISLIMYTVWLLPTVCTSLTELSYRTWRISGVYI